MCVFFFGGNDANNMIIPIDSRYAAYQAMRGPVALAADLVRPVGTSGYGLHPALVNMQRLYDQQQAALVFNVGTLVQPTTKQTRKSTRRSTARPRCRSPFRTAVSASSSRRWRRLSRSAAPSA